MEPMVPSQPHLGVHNRGNPGNQCPAPWVAPLAEDTSIVFSSIALVNPAIESLLLTLARDRELDFTLGGKLHKNNVFKISDTHVNSLMF